MTDHVNRIAAPVLPNVFEGAMRQLRAGLYQLSDTHYPGLRTRHYRLLAFIPDDGVRLSRIAEVSGLTKQALAQALQPLAAGGYVDVLPDPGDRRARVVRRTARGHEVVAAVVAMQQAFEAQWAARVGTQRWAAAREVLVDLFGSRPAPSGT